jgi:uncharacterized phage protein (TIGR01671 family)
MNRELKFRVWDTKNNEFVKLINFWVSPENLNKCFMEWRPELDGETVFETKNDAFVFQQFTGEYDKNNTPIYEGDIVKCEKPEIWLMEDFDKRESGIITYFNAAFHVAEKYTGGPIKGSIRLIKYRSIVDPYRLECEVIGNVFENSEFLKS